MADESKYPTRIAPYGLRMPDDLKARVQAAADANNRSMNAEIISRLNQSFAPIDRVALPDDGYDTERQAVSDARIAVLMVRSELKTLETGLQQADGEDKRSLGLMVKMARLRLQIEEARHSAAMRHLLSLPRMSPPDAPEE